MQGRLQSCSQFALRPEVLASGVLMGANKDHVQKDQQPQSPSKSDKLDQAVSRVINALGNLQIAAALVIIILAVAGYLLT